MRMFFAVLSLLFFSTQAVSATLSQKKMATYQSEKITAEQCATIKIGDKSLSSTDVVAQCSVFFEDFANMLIEGIGSSPLVGCRLLSDGTARLKTDPYVKLEKGTIIAIYVDPPILAKDHKLSSVMFPWNQNYKNCADWRAGAAASLVANPVPAKQQ